jgi:uncharacterized membrane protein YeaQ/YmgE (transglycosylase-associated protein family)
MIASLQEVILATATLWFANLAPRGRLGAPSSQVCSPTKSSAIYPIGSRIRAKDRGKSVHLSDQGLIVILIVGVIAGWLAGRAVRGSGFGLVGDSAIGIVGALIGDWLLHRLGVRFGSGIFGLTINATIGAILLLLALRLIGASGWGGR